MSASAVAERIAESSTKEKSDAPSTAKDALSALAAWIPSEALGVYTIGYGLLLAGVGPASPGTAPGTAPTLPDGYRWLVFGLAALVSVALIIFQTKQTLDVSGPVKQEATNSPKRRVGLSVALSLIALTIYVANIPGHPFTELTSGLNPGLAGLVAIVAAVLVPGVATYFGVGKP